MTHTIYLVRHGIAADAGPGERDADRALTTDGKHKLKQIAAGLKVLGVAPAVILASPLRRTRETADVLRRRLDRGGYKAKVIRVTTQPLGEVYRVRVGPFGSRDEAMKAMKAIRAEMKIDVILLKG